MIIGNTLRAGVCGDSDNRTGLVGWSMSTVRWVTDQRVWKSKETYMHSFRAYRENEHRRWDTTGCGSTGVAAVVRDERNTAPSIHRQLISRTMPKHTVRSSVMLFGTALSGRVKGRCGTIQPPAHLRYQPPSQRQSRRYTENVSRYHSWHACFLRSLTPRIAIP